MTTICIFQHIWTYNLDTLISFCRYTCTFATVEGFIISIAILLAGGQHGFHRWEKLFELKMFHYLIKKNSFSTRYTSISKLVSSIFLMLVLVCNSSFSLIFFTFITSRSKFQVPHVCAYMYVHVQYVMVTSALIF